MKLIFSVIVFYHHLLILIFRHLLFLTIYLHFFWPLISPWKVSYYSYKHVLHLLSFSTALACYHQVIICQILCSWCTVVFPTNVIRDVTRFLSFSRQLNSSLSHHSHCCYYCSLTPEVHYKLFIYGSSVNTGCRLFRIRPSFTGSLVILVPREMNLHAHPTAQDPLISHVYTLFRPFSSFVH